MATEYKAAQVQFGDTETDLEQGDQPLRPGQIAVIFDDETGDVIGFKIGKRTIGAPRSTTTRYTTNPRYVLFTPGDKSKLDDVEAGAQVNRVFTVHGRSENVVGEDGDYRADQIAETADAKIMTGVEREKLTDIEPGAQVNVLTSVNGYTGDPTLNKGDIGLGDVSNDNQVRHALDYPTLGSVADEDQFLVKQASDPAGGPKLLAASSLPTGTPASRQVATTNSLQGGGDLSANRTLQLVGDSDAPGNSQYYGTDGSGARGYYPLPALVPDTNEIPFQFVGNATAFTAMPAARTEWNNGQVRIFRDCTNVKHLRLAGIVTTAGPASGKWAVEYAPLPATTNPSAGDWVVIPGLEVSAAALGALGTVKIDCPAGAQGPAWWRLVGKDGDGVASPGGRLITLFWDDTAAKGDQGPAGASSAGEVNVMSAPYNAACNGTTDDTAAITAAATAVRTAGLGQVLVIPRRTKVSGTLDLRGISIRAHSNILMAPGDMLIVGNNSATAQPLNIDLLGHIGDGVYTGIQSSPYIRVIGKRLCVSIGATPYLQLYADTNSESDSTAYNDIYVRHAKKLELKSVGANGWINENRIWGGRVNALVITSGGYTHNNNDFVGVTLEPWGTEPFSVAFDHAHSNRVLCRCETGGSGVINTITLDATTAHNTFTRMHYGLVDKVYEPFNWPFNWVGTSGTATDNGTENDFQYQGAAQRYAAQGVVVTAPQASTAAWTWMADSREFIRIAPGDIIAWHFPGGGNWRSYLAIYDEAMVNLLTASGNVATHLDVIASALAWAAAPSGWEANSLSSSTDVTLQRTVIAVVKPGSTARWAKISIRTGSAAATSSKGARAVIYRRGDQAGIAPSQMIAPATSSLPGLLSGPDKAKLDSISSAASGNGLPPAAQLISAPNTTIASSRVFLDAGVGSSQKLPLSAGGVHEVLFLNRSGATVRITPDGTETINGMTDIDIPNNAWLKMVRAAPNWYEAP